MGLYTIIFYQPIFNLLIWLYTLLGNNITLAIIVLTVIIKLLLYPFSLRSIKSQKALQELQPKISALKIKYGDNKEQMAKEMMALYKQEKVNPLSSCLPLLIQLPFLFAVFQVFSQGLSSVDFSLLYSFVTNPGYINPYLIISNWQLDLKQPLWYLGAIAALAQYWQSKMLLKKRQTTTVAVSSTEEKMSQIMNKQMLYFMPILTVVFGLSLPAGLMLYWLINIILTIGQQYLVLKIKKPIDNAVK